MSRDHATAALDVSVEEAERNIDELIERAETRKERFVVQRRGRRVVAIVPVEDLALLDPGELPDDLRRQYIDLLGEHINRRIRRNGFSDADVDAHVDKVAREGRSSRRGH
jgi:prevent-host-death family protein